MTTPESTADSMGQLKAVRLHTSYTVSLSHVSFIFFPRCPLEMGNKLQV